MSTASRWTWKPTHEHVLVVHHGQPGDPFHRRGRVRVGVLLHLLGRQVVGDRRRLLSLDELCLGGKELGLDRIRVDDHLFSEAFHAEGDVQTGCLPGMDFDRHHDLFVAGETHPDLVGPSRHGHRKGAVEFRVDHCVRRKHGDRGAR